MTCVYVHVFVVMITETPADVGGLADDSSDIAHSACGKYLSEMAQITVLVCTSRLCNCSLFTADKGRGLIRLVLEHVCMKTG